MKQSLDLFYEDTELHAEVDRRLRALRANPDELLRRFDSNGDGILDANEWAAVRRVIADTVLAQQENHAAPELESELVDGRYRLLSELGRGAQGQTHLARDLEHDRLVAIKLLNVAGVTEWKHFELLQREAQVLGELQHKRIPALYDSFETEVDGKPGIAVVQEYISGDNLEFRLAAGELFDEKKLLRIAEDVLVILSYLHRLDPPVIHRDVKPANIIVDENQEVALVDFGAVQIEGTAQDTVIGTSGYMPPEQLMSRPTLASDVYSLGATLVHLATRTHPGQLESQRMKLQWRDRANLSQGFMDLVDRMLEPALEDRFESTVDALKALESVRSYGQMSSSRTSRTRAVAQVEPHQPVVRGKIIYEGPHMLIRESEDTIAIELTRDDMFKALGVAAVPFAVVMTVGMGMAVSFGAVVLFAVILALPGLGFALYLKLNPRDKRLIEFVSGDQLTIREDGVITRRKSWVTNPSLEATRGRYPVVKLHGEYLEGPLCRIVRGEEREMIPPVNSFLRKHRNHYHELQRTPLVAEEEAEEHEAQVHMS